jgi:hypothetical protein
MSSTWCCVFKGDTLDAANALESDVNTMAHTVSGRGHWWSAQFEDGMREVSEVKITNRADCCGDRLRLTEVWIGDRRCGVLPNVTANGVVYTVPCVDDNGDAIKITGD